MRALGANQLGMIRGMQHRNGVWYAGCGWYWNNTSGTVRIMESLVKRGLVEWVSYCSGPRHYSLTDAGKAVKV